jgi:hypothetical protein
MPGPAPKPQGQTRRRNAPMANTVQLPSGGRQGDAPEWPLAGEAPQTWDQLWATPQAVAWERLGWTRVVARYVHILVLCENPAEMTAALLGEARQLEDRLGLTPMAMLRLRWEIAADEVAEQRAIRPGSSSARRKLKVADDALAGA